MGGIIDDVIKVSSLGLVNTDISGKKAANDALNNQRNSVFEANSASQRALDSQTQEMAPWKKAGIDALAGLQSGNFMANDAGYKFRLDQGNNAINAAAAARGMGNSGATMKALTKYGGDMASQEYGNAYNRQLGLANMGYGASNNMANFIGGHGTGQAQRAIDFGNANAASNIAGSNRDMALLNSAVSIGSAFAGMPKGKAEPENTTMSNLTAPTSQYSLGNYGQNNNYANFRY